MSIENVYIFGAGASADLGIPLMSNFIDKMEDLYQINWYDDPNLYKSIIEDIRRLRGILSKVNIDIDNLESALGMLDMRNTLENDIENRTNFARKIKCLIAETIDLTSSYRCGDRNLLFPDSYAKFLDIISDKIPSSAFITFNYDIGIEVAMARKGVNYGYYLNDTSGIPLLKLHGSVNWYTNNDDEDELICKYIGQADIIFTPHEEHFEEKANNSYFYTQKWLRARSSANFTPYIVLPTWNKTISNISLSRVWKKSMDVLKTAKNIYLIGFSMPDTDLYFKFLLAEGLNSDTRIRSIKLINPDSEVDEKLNLLLNENLKRKYTFYDKYFANTVIGGGEIYK